MNRRLIDPDRSGGDQLSILLLSYQLAMEAERGFFTTAAVVLGVAGASLAGLASLSQSAVGTGTEALGEWVWALVPVVPLLALGFLVHQAGIGTARGPYLLALEEELQRAAQVRITMQSRDFRQGIQVPGYHHLMLPLLSRRRAPAAYATLWVVMNALTGVLVVAIVGVALSTVWGNCVWSGILLAELAVALFLLGLAAFTLLRADRFCRHIWRALP